VKAAVDSLKVLAATSLFKGFPEDQLAPLLPALHPRSYGSGSFLFHEGDPGNVLYIILEGQVKIAHLGPSGEEVVYAILMRGDTFGELALFDESGLHAADAQAMEATSCLTLEKEALQAFLDRHPAAVRHLMMLFSRIIRSTDQGLAEAAFLDIPGRVARKLLDLAESHGEDTPKGRRLTMRLPQRTLAGMVGASRENVNRALARLVARGDIGVEAGHIILMRPEELRKRG
jgi:CRP/FNR family transcriptional regulator/CRP/FNR family cyclic AMP-dependent transcriptional regulator